MSKNKVEKVSAKTAAEFFAEHQQLAGIYIIIIIIFISIYLCINILIIIFIGFDNPGKSLFTSIRELVENSLDAAETARVYYYYYYYYYYHQLLL